MKIVWKSLFTDVFFFDDKKKNDSFVKYGSTLIYVKILLSCWIANLTSTSKLQTIQVLKVLCKRVPQNLCCWNNVERKFSTHIFTFSKHCYVLSLEILRISLWKVAEMKRFTIFLKFSKREIICHSKYLNLKLSSRQKLSNDAKKNRYKIFQCFSSPKYWSARQCFNLLVLREV